MYRDVNTHANDLKIFGIKYPTIFHYSSASQLQLVAPSFLLVRIVYNLVVIGGEEKPPCKRH